jgi:uncharacterized membrane protein (UPF0182 family)
MPQRSARVLALLAGLLIVFAGPSLLRFYTDWLWFGEVGYRSVYTTMLRSQGTLFTIVFVAAFVWLAANLRLAVGTIRDLRPVFITREGIEVALPNRHQLQTLATAAALVVAILIGLYAAGQWEVWMAWRNAVPFNEADPLLGRDVGFYVFTLPFLQVVRGLLQGLIVLAAIGAGAIYFVSGSMSSTFPASFSMTGNARRHLSLLAAAFLFVLAFGAWLQRAEFLIPAAGATAGAGYADVHGRMPATLVLTAVAAIGAGLAAWQAFTARNWPIPAAIGLYLAVSLGGSVYGSLLQRFVVTPNEQARETPYIQNNIEATRRAFGLDAIEVRQISGDAMLVGEDIERNAATLQNVRLWDHQPLLETFSQIQEIRTYYDFASIDNDRYRLDGELRQVMLSGRELNSTSLPNRTWVNERLTYTHGYGLTLGPVNQATSQGLPVLYVRDLPPVTTAGLDIVEPSIYYGELSNDYVIVRTEAPEFHYPKDEGDQETRYDGRGGVPLGSLWRQLIFALRFGSYQILLNDDIGAESRILFNRRIGDRVRTIAGEFLRLDQDPYLVLADGRLYWIYDAYTTSRRYPYSSHAADGSNYWRNSVKFVIDAYHGTVTAYLADTQDPIAATYARIFPELFTPMDRMPPSLREHIRYPEDIFAVQSQMYATYHMTQASVFYNREDQWEIPTIDESADGRASTMQPYYTIMRLPGEQEPEFIQMLPFTPRRRDNLAAWLVARSDGEHYGSLRVFEFPKQKLVYGPRQVVARISQDQTISPQITLWNQQGSQVIWGTLMVIPIEESLIYVRPLYLRAQGGRIPELTRVVAAYEDRIVMEETLDAALARLFGTEAAPREAAPEEEGVRSSDAPAQPSSPDQPASGAAAGALAAQARTHYDRAIAAQRSGDWARYGEEIRLLGDVLNRMRAQQ